MLICLGDTINTMEKGREALLTIAKVMVWKQNVSRYIDRMEDKVIA
jgi:hypothetical protein